MRGRWRCTDACSDKLCISEDSDTGGRDKLYLGLGRISDAAPGVLEFWRDTFAAFAESCAGGGVARTRVVLSCVAAMTL